MNTAANIEVKDCEFWPKHEYYAKGDPVPEYVGVKGVGFPLTFACDVYIRRDKDGACTIFQDGSALVPEREKPASPT